VTYSSSNEKVATVDAAGNIKAVGAGKATITASVQNYGLNAKTAACTVEVVPAKNAEVPVGTNEYKVITTGTTGGTVIATAPTKKSLSSIVVPSSVTISGAPYEVTAIAANAYKGMTKLTKLTVGKNIKTIGTKACYKDKKLKAVTFTGKKLTKIGKNAFKGCNSKIVFQIPKSKYKSVIKLLKKSGIPKASKFKAI
jgi:hypothetical protein